MSRLWCVVAMLAFAVVPPRSFQFRIRLDAPPELSADRARVDSALQRGLFLDSLIVPGNNLPKFDASSLAADSATRANWTSVVVVSGSIAERGQTLEIRLRLLNILGQAIGGPDTLRTDRSALDSAVVEQGRRYAKALAKGRH